ncbi:MAG TPA: lysophospholipid acyltransferase family protein [Paucimonas sp.]|nr:lysophospholipid acyltransferase family protein [Paucimonas sp.]
MYRLFLFLRSLLFLIWMIVVTVLFAPTCFVAAPFPYRTRYWWTGRWNLLILWGARNFCGIRHQVKGLENLPQGPAVVLSKHQSAWETIFLYLGLGHPLLYVFKKELTYVPFFGWGIALLRMIPIDRSKGKDAFTQVVEIGKKRLAEDDVWVIMFPEGTRTKVGSQGKYKLGGARFAIETGVQVVPVALNSGECWPKNSFIKKPGLITVSIGKPIQSAGREPAELMQEVENWIESEMRVISPHAYSTTDCVAKQVRA